MTTEKTTASPAEEAPAQPLSLEEELVKCRQELAAETDKRLRVLAETENLKKRLIKEKEDFVRFAAEGVLSDMVPVLDNLDLALEHGRSVSACKDFVMGVEMTRKVFLDILARHGLEAFGTPGEAFNPELHEAMGALPDKNVPEGHIISVMLKGYSLRGRLLRPAKAMVSKG